MSNKVDKLRQYGFEVVWVEPSVMGNNLGYINRMDTSVNPVKGDLPYVELGMVAKGEDAYGQSDTVMRSNYRSLRRDYPDIWTDTSYSNVDVLGAFVADLPDDVIDILIGLKNEYALYDDDDLSSLENDEITESWDQYVRSDIQSELYKRDLEDQWNALDDDGQRDLFWRCVRETDNYPEHSGLDIIWPKTDKVLDRMEKYLTGQIEIVPDNQLTLDDILW